MEDVYTDETCEARRLLETAFETVPGDPATAGDGLLRGVRRRDARRRRTRALVSAGAAAAATVAAAAVLLSGAAAGPSPALAAVTSALSQAATGSFRMNLVVTQRYTVPGQSTMKPLHVTGALDLKQNHARLALSNGWRTLIVGGKAYTKLLPGQAARYGTGGKLWTEESGPATEPPYPSPGANLAWDFNSDRPFDPQAVLALLESGARVRDEGHVSRPGWTGTRYGFSLRHPKGTRGLVDSITGTVVVDSHKHIRSLRQTTAFVASGVPRSKGKMIYTTDFTFSDFGIRVPVTAPPAGRVDHDLGVAFQF
jgi:hypothetical protein